jgi:hypothetical protein
MSAQHAAPPSPNSTPDAGIQTHPSSTSADLGHLVSPDYEWSQPENLGPGVNSDKDEYALGISDDGLLLVLSSRRDSSEHLFECRRQSPDEPFGKAVLIGELQRGLQSTPFLSADGLTLLYGLQPQAGAIGDIYQSHRASRTEPWGKPSRLFPPAAYNAGPCLSTDGLTLWFHSNRPGGRGGFDLWRAHRASADAPFDKPVNLGAGVNTDLDELSPRFTADGRGVLFYRERNHTDERLFLAQADASGVFTARPLPLPIHGRVQSPALSADGQILYFASDMTGGMGGWDLWQIRRLPKTPSTPPQKEGSKSTPN